MKLLLIITTFLIPAPGRIESKKFSAAQSDKAFSKVFLGYEQEYDSLIVYSVDNNFQNKLPYRVIGIKKGVWYLADYYATEKDSIAAHECSSCATRFDLILKTGLLSLPDESLLPQDCRSVKDTLVNGTPVKEVSDLNLVSDLEMHRLEYKIGNIKKQISYRSPGVALEICPGSKERSAVMKIIELIKNASADDTDRPSLTRSVGVPSSNSRLTSQ